MISLQPESVPRRRCPPQTSDASYAPGLQSVTCNDAKCIIMLVCNRVTFCPCK
jgi:hypothetical protein